MDSEAEFSWDSATHRHARGERVSYEGNGTTVELGSIELLRFGVQAATTGMHRLPSLVPRIGKTAAPPSRDGGPTACVGHAT